MLQLDLEMRFSLPALLLCSSALAGVLVTGCAADTEAPADGETALGDDELNAVNNKMGLRLTYDDPSGHVRATMKAKLHAGEKLVMRVRRGRLASGAQTVLDCSQLAEASVLPVSPTTATTSTTTAATTAKAIYVGPELDRSMLACVYTQQWVDQNIPPDVVQELSVDGADSIVDACIVRQEAVRARLQTSLQYAWDASDPHIDPALVHSR